MSHTNQHIHCVGKTQIYFKNKVGSRVTRRASSHDKSIWVCYRDWRKALLIIVAVPTHNRQMNAGISSPCLITEFTSTNPQSACQIISILCSNDDQCLLMYGCETWSLHLRQKRRLSEKRMLLGIFVHKEEDTTLHNEELHNLYCSPTCI